MMCEVLDRCFELGFLEQRCRREFRATKIQ